MCGFSLRRPSRDRSGWRNFVRSIGRHRIQHLASVSKLLLIFIRSFLRYLHASSHSIKLHIHIRDAACISNYSPFILSRRNMDEMFFIPNTDMQSVPLVFPLSYLSPGEYTVLLTVRKCTHTYKFLLFMKFKVHGVFL